jgi:hypothetical protein
MERQHEGLALRLHEAEVLLAGISMANAVR